MRQYFSTSFRIGPLGPAAFAMGLILSQMPASASNEVLVPHRAIYTLSLDEIAEGGRVTSADGRIVFEFTGSKCSGYTVQFRYISEFGSGNGNTRLSDYTTSTYESGDHKDFNFATSSKNTGQPEKQTDGIAKRSASATKIQLNKPSSKQVELAADVVFPTEHVVMVLEAARRQQLLVDATLYDGGDDGEKAIITSTVIGRERSLKDVKAGVDKDFPELKGLARWPVTVSYFDKARSSGELTPFYVTRFKLYENGVSGDLLLDYKSFKLRAKLEQLEMFQTEKCD